MKEKMKQAHQMTKEIVANYGDVDYFAQFRLCLAYLLGKKEEKELIGSEKQIEWAKEIREAVLIGLEGLKKEYFAWVGEGWELFLQDQVQEDEILKVTKEVKEAGELIEDFSRKIHNETKSWYFINEFKTMLASVNRANPYRNFPEEHYREKYKKDCTENLKGYIRQLIVAHRFGRSRILVEFFGVQYMWEIWKKEADEN